MYNPILTAIGKAKIADAIANNTTVNINKLAVGDGNGTHHIPAESQTALVNETYRTDISSITINPDNPSLVEMIAVIPSNVGGFTIREVAVFDSDGDMIAVSDHPDFGKFIISGSANILEIKFMIAVTNTESITLVVDDSAVYATRRFVTDQFISKEDGVSKVELTEVLEGYSIIDKPSIVSPANGAIDYASVIVASPMGTGSSFQGTLDYIRFQLATDENFTNIIDDNDLGISLSYSPNNLEPLTDYYVRVKQGSDKHLSSWSDSVKFTTPVSLIEKPSVISPLNGEVISSATITFASSVYNSFADNEPHLSTTWQLATDVNFTDIVDESIDDTINLTSWEVQNLQIDKKYYVRVLYKSEHYVSGYSDTVNFWTPDGSINKPTILTPVDGTVNMAQTITVTADTYSTFGHSEPHLSSTWQISDDVDFTNIIDESIDDIVNLTSWTSSTLPFNKTYYTRVKYKSAGFESTFSEVISFSIPAVSINTPTILTPTTGSIVANVTPTITSSAYSVFGHSQPHLSTTWQISDDANFLNIVAQSVNDTVNLTSWTAPTLPNGKTYYVRAMYKSSGYSSAYSFISTFTVPVASVYAPSITSPLNNALNIGKNATITADAYSVFGHSEPHLSSTWQIATDQYFSNIVSQSINDTLNLTSWSSSDLQVSTSYYARVKYNSASYSSEFSSAIKFTTKSQFTISAGTAGGKGFSVAPTDQPFALLGLAEMLGTNDPASDNYGNYIHTNGSIVCWLPKTFYRVGHSGSPRFATYGANALDMVGTDVFATEAEANASGYALHRCFINGGKEQPGVFVDKYMNSKDGTTASKSVFGGVPISLMAATAGWTTSGGMTGCTGILADAVVLSKARGERWNATTAFIYGYLALVSVAQAQAATSTADVAWYDPTGVKNYPKGCNNSALSDVDDTTVKYASAGDSGNANKPKTGATANFAKTTHNGSANGVADLNGGMFEVTIGITNFGSSATATTAIANDQIYVLKHSTDIATLTGGWNGATDVWGNAANLGTKYDVISSPHPLGSATEAVYWGNGTNAVLQNDLNGVNRDLCGFIPKNSSSTSATGANLFGNDYFYKYNVQNMVPLACGHWSRSATAGVFYRHFGTHRSYGDSYYGFRASAYFS